MTITARNLIAPRFAIILGLPYRFRGTTTRSGSSQGRNMSTLRHGRDGTDLPEPDSELRAALQRVARDLEHDSHHHTQDGNIDLQNKPSAGIHRSQHRKGTSIHVEDILDQVSSAPSMPHCTLKAESSF